MNSDERDLPKCIRMDKCHALFPEKMLEPILKRFVEHHYAARMSGNEVYNACMTHLG